MQFSGIKELLDQKVEEYNQPFFIASDPVSIPHRFSKKQDVEIAGLFASLFAWGNRKSIIASSERLMILMNGKPYDFLMNTDFKKTPRAFDPFRGFVHRTFNDGDLWHLFNFLQYHYRTTANESLESAFTRWMKAGDDNIEKGLEGFYNYVFGYSEEAGLEKHCRKHISTPAKKSACKRLNMFLRWMVRDDDKGVDFGIWKKISPSRLVCPLDLHVTRVALHFKLIERKQADWVAAQQLTEILRSFDPADPVKYDFALFGLGVAERY